MATRGVFSSSEKFPGRWILVASFTLLMFSAGVGFYGLAVYLQAFSRELGWSVSSISLATTFFFLVGGVSGLSIAKFIAKFTVNVTVRLFRNLPCDFVRQLDLDRLGARPKRTAISTLSRSRLSSDDLSRYSKS